MIDRAGDMDVLKGRRALVFINNSSGELDWIAPFVIDAAGDLEFFVYIHHPRLPLSARRDLFDQYFGEEPRITYLNDRVTFRELLARLDLFMDSALLRMRRISAAAFRLGRVCVDVIRAALARFYFSKIRDVPSFDLVFRDYNLKNSMPLCRLLAANPATKVVIFPHSTAIISVSARLPKDPLRRVAADLFLGNTRRSTRFLPAYGDVFREVGSPQMSSNYDRVDRLFEPATGAVLIITRNCDPFFFGFTQEDANRVFRESLAALQDRGVRAFVKHHPRDVHVAEWRRVQSDFVNVVEVDHSLNSYDEPTAYVLTFYSSAGLILASQGIPVFDVSPYSKERVDELPYHFMDEEGEVSHEFLELGLMDRVLDPRLFVAEVDSKALEQYARAQEQALKCVFPPDANGSIRRATRDLFLGAGRADS